MVGLTLYVEGGAPFANLEESHIYAASSIFTQPSSVSILEPLPNNNKIIKK